MNCFKARILNTDDEENDERTKVKVGIPVKSKVSRPVSETVAAFVVIKGDIRKVASPPRT